MGQKLTGHHCLIYPVRPIICKHYTCHGFADPSIHAATCTAMLDEAKQEPIIERDHSIFLTPRSLRYAIWPKRFPDYKETKLIFGP